MKDKLKVWLAKIILVLVFGMTCASLGYLFHAIILPLTLLQGLLVVGVIAIGWIIAYGLWWAIGVLGIKRDKYSQ